MGHFEDHRRKWMIEMDFNDRVYTTPGKRTESSTTNSLTKPLLENNFGFGSSEFNWRIYRFVDHNKKLPCTINLLSVCFKRDSKKNSSEDFSTC